jgi:hypothetical protein
MAMGRMARVKFLLRAVLIISRMLLGPKQLPMQ